MENQESLASTEVPFDVTEIIADDINMEDIVVTPTRSSDIAEKAIGMNKSPITFYLNRSSQYIRMVQSKNLLLATCCNGREIKTLITQDLFKEMDKPTILNVKNTASKQVYTENATP
ncbi:5447_t:CDS:2, partial [Acaulospora colombiana]